MISDEIFNFILCELVRIVTFDDLVIKCSFFIIERLLHTMICGFNSMY